MSQKKDLKKTMGPRSRKATPVAATFTNETADAAGAGGVSLQTSVRLPTDLHRQARYYSIDNGLSLNQLIIEGLQLRLNQ